jgi:hypothetical protein
MLTPVARSPKLQNHDGQSAPPGFLPPHKDQEATPFRQSIVPSWELSGMLDRFVRISAIATPLLLVQTLGVSAQGVIPPGRYECWYFSRAQPGLNFTVNGGGSYTDVEGKPGKISLSGAGQIAFSGGAHDGSNAVYKGGNPPTISFVSPRGAEAAFCQLAR